MILALDPSSTACGWAIFLDTHLHDSGCVWRKKAQCETSFGYAVADEVGRGWTDDTVCYEQNTSPQPRVRQSKLIKCHRVTGRILQALGLEGIPVKPDNKSKAKRRADMTLIYKLGKVSEHEIDAIALGHRVVSGAVKGAQ